MLIGGTGTAVAWDDACYWQMRYNRSIGQDPRAAINNGGSYAAHIWVSYGGRGSQLEVEVPRGTTTIPLQLNGVTFVCSSLVSPDGAGADYGSNDGRIVKSGNAPNDRRPNPMGGSTNWPAFAGSRFRVDSTSASPAGSVGLGGGTVLSYLRDNNSRYWFANPLRFNYTKSGGFTETTNVTVTVRGRHISQFYDWAWHCTPAGPNFIGGWNYNTCPQQSMSFNIKVTVKYYELTPTISSVSSAALEPGQRVNVTGNVAKASSGMSTTSPTDTRYTRIIWKGGQSAPKQTAGTSTSDACVYYNMSGANASRCTQIGSTMGNTFNNYSFTGTGRAMGQMTDTVPDDFGPGDRICYGISVRGYSESTGPSKSGARHSALRCVMVGKKPKVHVTGGDLYVGRGGTSGLVATSTSTDGTEQVNVPNSVTEQEIRNTQRFWYFGKGAALDFAPSSGAAPKNLPRTKEMEGYEGATVATNREGKMQFFTDGKSVHSLATEGGLVGKIMKNGTGLNASATTTQAAAVFPISNNRYVIVTSSARTEDHLLGKLQYSVVDMNKQEVVTKNRALGPQGSGNGVGEALAVVPSKREGNDKGYWVVTNKPGTSIIRAFHIPYNWAAGPNDGASIAPVDSDPGDGVVSGKSSGQFAPGFGTINFYTPDNKYHTKMVITMRRETGTGTIRTLNFNAETGKFTKQFAWNVTGASVYSGDFSPDGNYVYFTSLYNSGTIGDLHRYKLSGATTSAQVAATKQDIAVGASGLRGCTSAGGGGQVKSAPDGKMYVANYGCNKIGVINNPNSTGNIGWNSTGFTLASGATSSFGLPQIAAVLPVSVEPPVYSRTVYGSWSEYGIAAAGQVTGMASAAGYAGGIQQEGATLVTPDLCSLSLLTLANRDSSNSCGVNTMGRYRLPASVATIVDRYASQADKTLGTAIAPETDAAGLYKAPATGTGTVTIRGGTMPLGKTIVIYAPNRDVIIENSLNYDTSNTTGRMNSIKRIPQLIIIARNISINANATNVDAWLVAVPTGTTNGVIQTCREYATPTQNQCGNKLTVNGPVISKKLIMNRTAGATKGQGGPAPAEVFNLRPDAYLWGAAQSTETGRIPTASITELPPRF